MWHRLQVLVRKDHVAWLKRKSFETGKSIGAIVRELIDKAMKS